VISTSGAGDAPIHYAAQMDVRRRGALVAVFAVALTVPSVARAEEPPAEAPPAEDAKPPPSTARRALAITAAIVLEGIGLGLVAAGGLPIGLSGAAGETMPGLVLLLPGSALVFTTLAADVWGAAGGARLAGEPLAPDELQLALGYKMVGDPRVDFTNVATGDFDVRRTMILGSGSFWLGDGYWRVAGTAGVRLLGPRPGRLPVSDGSSIDLTVTGAEESRSGDDYAVTTFDGGIRGRLDLFHVAPSLRGSFVRGGMGLGAERIRYTAVDAADVSGIVTAHFAWGFQVGDGHDRALEAELFYEHRRDTLAGGLTIPSSTNGFVGYFGATATGWRGLWGATATVEAGSAWIVSLAARYRIPEVSR
jgi:hypothetical protein